MTRLHRFTLNPDASFLIWRRDTLVVAPLFTGVVQVPLGFMSSEELLLVWIKAEWSSIFCDKATNQNLPWQAILPRCLTPRPPPTRRGNPWLGHSGTNWTHPLQKKRTYKIFCRKIDAVAAFENLAATAESRQDLVSKPLTLQTNFGLINQFFCYRTIRLWDLTTSCSLVSWVATKTYIR